MLEKIGFIYCADTEFFIDLIDDCMAKLYMVREKLKKEDEENDEL